MGDKPINVCLLSSCPLVFLHAHILSRDHELILVHRACPGMLHSSPRAERADLFFFLPSPHRPCPCTSTHLSLAYIGSSCALSAYSSRRSVSRPPLSASTRSRSSRITLSVCKSGEVTCFGELVHGRRSREFFGRGLYRTAGSRYTRAVSSGVDVESFGRGGDDRKQTPKD